ncbi:UNVERIFIED_CONTAM: hypothetical protein Sindi_1993700, partial [Sesamum indicum]
MQKFGVQSFEESVTRSQGFSQPVSPFRPHPVLCQARQFPRMPTAEQEAVCLVHIPRFVRPEIRTAATDIKVGDGHVSTERLVGLEISLESCALRGMVPLRVSRYSDSFVDKFATIFNNSSRRTLKYIKQCIPNGEVVIRPSLSMIRDQSRLWKHTAVGYFLGKKAYFHHFNASGRSIWPAVKDVITISNGFYFFQFNTLATMEEVIKGGHWLFQDQPIVLQRWEPGMALSKHKHTQLPVWIRLRHQQVEFWTLEGLSTVASRVGKPLYPDAITKPCTRLDFARVCVILDVSSKLPKHLVLLMPMEDGTEVPCKVDVKYEWLPIKCRACMSLGHDAKTCPTTKKRPPQPVKVYVLRPPIERGAVEEEEGIVPPWRMYWKYLGVERGPKLLPLSKK